MRTSIDKSTIIKKLGDKYYLARHPDPLVKGHCLLFKSDSIAEARTGPKKNLKHKRFVNISQEQMFRLNFSNIKKGPNSY